MGTEGKRMIQEAETRTAEDLRMKRRAEELQRIVHHIPPPVKMKERFGFLRSREYLVCPACQREIEIHLLRGPSPLAGNDYRHWRLAECSCGYAYGSVEDVIVWVS